MNSGYWLEIHSSPNSCVSQRRLKESNHRDTAASSAALYGDEGRIRQALLVLLENARHHGGDYIANRVEQAAGGCRLIVEDSGPGMSSGEKQQAFERFCRGSNSARRYAQGAGLGLPVALSIAQAHGGTIELEDRSGGGLRAVIVLPQRPDTEAAA